MKNIFRIVLAVAAIAITAQVTPVAAQDNNLVTGIVVDKYDSPIPGVLVARKGASKKHFVSDVTGVDGTFSLPASKKLKSIRAVYGGYRSVNKHVTPEMHIKMKKNNLNYANHWFVSLQGIQADKDNFKPAIGLMTGWSGKVGFYVKAATTELYYNRNKNKYFAWGYYEIIDGKVGKRDFGFTSFTGGLVVRLCRPLYLYAGGGYVKKDIYYQFIGNPKNIHEPKGSFKSYAIDGGLMFKFKGFNLSGGCIYTPQGGFYGNVGIGFWI